MNRTDFQRFSRGKCRTVSILLDVSLVYRRRHVRGTGIARNGGSDVARRARASLAASPSQSPSERQSSVGVAAQYGSGTGQPRPRSVALRALPKDALNL